jgi:hypothetical protein
VGGVNDLTKSAQNFYALPTDAIFLLVLTIGHMWFNPVSNALVVFLLAIYILAGILSPSLPDEVPTPRLRERLFFLIRLSIVLFVLAIAAVLPTLWNVSRRHSEGPATHVNDGLIQTESAIQFLLNARNPYTENYLNTPMADWKGGEPPWTPTESTLHHNAYLPILFIGSIPFYLASQNLLGWYDQRLLYLLIYLIVLLLIPRFVDGQRNQLLTLLIFGLNFLSTHFLAEGRNDIVVLFGLLLATAFAKRGQIEWSACALGLTMAVKHSAWFFLFFWIVYLLPRPLTWKNANQLLRVLPLGLVIAIVFIPFLVWDAAAFWDDTITYVIGAGAGSYPIRGWGFSTLLLAFGVIPSPYAAFPFGIFQIIFGLPTLIVLLIQQYRENTVRRMWMGYAMFFFVITFFSRFLNDHYFIFALQVFLLGAFMSPLRQSQATDSQADRADMLRGV